MLRKLEKNQEKTQGRPREGKERMIVRDKNSERSEQHPTSTLGYLPLIMRRETFFQQFLRKNKKGVIC